MTGEDCPKCQRVGRASPYVRDPHVHFCDNPGCRVIGYRLRPVREERREPEALS